MISKIKNGINIGFKLRKLRMEKGYSQEYMAEVLEVSQKTYSNMENDKSSISIDTLKKIAEEYNIDMLQLLSNGKVVVENNNSHDSSTFQGGIIYNHMNDEILHQKDLLLEEKDKRIVYLEKSNDEKDRRIELLETRLFGDK